MKISGFTKRISFNSPAILGFTIICLITLILNQITQGTTNRLFFSVYRSSLLDPLTYFRFIGHAFRHANFSHFIGNFMMILVVGPLLEEKYGTVDMICIIITAALITGLANFILFPRVAVLGASGVLFAFILLSSFTSFKEGTIPLTFILVALLYIGENVYSAIFIKDNVSNFSHILGGIVGAYLGYNIKPKKR
ncbi:MAG: rhomboid family intramembrane serine protease [Lachnospiraceae bacterium]|nr:rhomboid family intramembrane serine protease [Lachnospiraceae bacterium]